jgi:hypothetical protein
MKFDEIEDEQESVESEHVDGVPDGCTEIWEHLSEQRAEN